MSDSTPTPTTISYGDQVKLEWAKLPQASQHALMQYGLSHALGNQCSSKLVAWKKTEAGAKASKTEVEAQAKLFFDTMLANIKSGELGTRSVGPRAPTDPVADKALAMATDAVRAESLKRGISWPKAKIAEAGKSHFEANRDKFMAQAKKELEKLSKTTDPSLDALFAPAKAA